MLRKSPAQAGQKAIRARQRCAVGQRFVTASVEKVAIQNVTRKQAELTGRSSTLALKKGLWQAGLLGSGLRNRICAGFDFVRDAI